MIRLGPLDPVNDEVEELNDLTYEEINKIKVFRLGRINDKLKSILGWCQFFGILVILSFLIMIFSSIF